MTGRRILLIESNCDFPTFFLSERANYEACMVLLVAIRGQVASRGLLGTIIH
jgi:hypothetical protein